MLPRRHLGAATLLVLLISGIAALAYAGRRTTPLPVTVEIVARRDLVSTVTASGYIQPKYKVDISADVSGRVVGLLVGEGQWVTRGQLLLRIDPTAFEANVARAEAALAYARAQSAESRATLRLAKGDARRAEGLARAPDLIAHAELERVRTRLRVAKAQREATEHTVAQAEAALAESLDQLRKTTIAAPMSGFVTRLNIQAGETAVVGTINSPGSLLLTIADLGAMEARMRVNETEVPWIEIGDSASVHVDAFPERPLSGRVSRIGNSALLPAGGPPAGRQGSLVEFEVTLALDEIPPALRPDLTATAEIVVGRREQVLAVPILAVTIRDEHGRRPGFERAQDRQGGPATAGNDAAPKEMEGVFVVRDGIARWVPIHLGVAGERHFEVLAGLDGGEAVVAGPYATVRDLEAGAAIRVVGGEATRDSRIER